MIFLRSSQTRDYTGAKFAPLTERSRQDYNLLSMRFLFSACILLLCCPAFAQKKQAQPAPQSVTVPATIDQNRVIIDVDVLVRNGITERIHALIDPGNPDLFESARVAQRIGRPIIGTGWCNTEAPTGVVVGGMEISFNGVEYAAIVKENCDHQDTTEMVPSVEAEMNLPSTVLRHYDVLIDFPGHKVTIGPPGSISFLGSAQRVELNPDNGLIQVPSKLENKKYNFGLDLGSPLSFLSADLFDPLAAAHPDWPHMTGGVGPANQSGSDEETKWKLMRIDRLQYGPLFLVDVLFVDFDKNRFDLFAKRAGIPTVGFLGAQVFQNYRVGLDYAHSTVYFDIGRLANFPDFDVVGLVLHPEDDGRFTVTAVIDFDGKPSVSGVQAGDTLVAVDGVAMSGSTMGQVWSALRGTPGQERRLTMERAGKQFSVVAQVQHFLPETPDPDQQKKQKGKK
jgi:hypothetical protein